jgi:hypothetical protein
MYEWFIFFKNGKNSKIDEFWGLVTCLDARMGPQTSKTTPKHRPYRPKPCRYAAGHTIQRFILVKRHTIRPGFVPVSVFC